MANSEIFQVTASSIAQRLDVFERCGGGHDMLAANPARNFSMQLTGYCLVYFFPRK
jgi:hypothetical protein